MTAGIWPRLDGPTGVRVGGDTPWVRGFYHGVPIAGVSFRVANLLEDAGRGWIIQHIAYNWGADIARKVNAPVAVDDGRSG